MNEKHKRKYHGTSAGANATMEEALKNALAEARKGENTNHFSWSVSGVSGEVGGVVGGSVVIEVTVR